MSGAGKDAIQAQAAIMIAAPPEHVAAMYCIEV